MHQAHTKLEARSCTHGSNRLAPERCPTSMSSQGTRCTHPNSPALCPNYSAASHFAPERLAEETVLFSEGRFRSIQSATSAADDEARSTASWCLPTPPFAKWWL